MDIQVPDWEHKVSDVRQKRRNSPREGRQVELDEMNERKRTKFVRTRWGATWLGCGGGKIRSLGLGGRGQKAGKRSRRRRRRRTFEGEMKKRKRNTI